MPEFENLEAYQLENPKKGESRIIPIAPHSLRAEEYHPPKTAREQRVRPRKNQVKEVNVEPVDIRQMEKAFRKAARMDDPFGLKWISSIFKSLKKAIFSKKKKTKRKPNFSGKKGSPKGNLDKPKQNKSSDGNPNRRDGKRAPRSNNNSNNNNRRNSSRNPNQKPRSPKAERGNEEGKERSPSQPKHHSNNDSKATADQRNPNQRNRRNRNRNRNRRPKGDDNSSNSNNSGNSTPNQGA